MKKQVITMRVGDYEPTLLGLTLPLIARWAAKCGAEFRVIDTPLFKMPSITYEKFQLYEVSKGYDWTTFLDADTLIHPDAPDWCEMLHKDTVCFHGTDLSLNRFRASDYVRRSHSLNGACTWFTIFSDWCRDMWHPMTETTWDECMANITPICMETASGCCTKEHLIDDYLVTQNIARYGLKTTTVGDLLRSVGRGNEQYMHHLYACSSEKKLAETIRVITEVWKI